MGYSCQPSKGYGQEDSCPSRSRWQGQADLQSNSQKSSEVDRLTVGANHGGNQANLCSPGRWPVENNPEKSKQVPAKNFRIGRSDDLWTCKRFWSPTSGESLWPPDLWAGLSAQRMSNISFFSDKSLFSSENPFLSHEHFVFVLMMLLLSTTATWTQPSALAQGYEYSRYAHRDESMLSAASALVLHKQTASCPSCALSQHHRNISLLGGSQNAGNLRSAQQQGVKHRLTSRHLLQM